MKIVAGLMGGSEFCNLVEVIRPEVGRTSAEMAETLAMRAFD
jgi:hypothetical protein